MLKTLKEKDVQWVDKLPILIDKNGNYQFIEGKDKEIKELKGKDRLNLNSYATAADCMSKLCRDYNCENYEPYLKRDIASVKYGMLSCGYYKAINKSYVFAENISQELVSIICEKYQDVNGLRIALSSSRKISNSDIAPHIVGVTGRITEEQYNTLKEKGYTIEDIVGKSGIEAAMEEYLRGESGEKKVELSRDGTVRNVLQSKNANPGKTVFLTIDSRIQDVANKSLEKYVNAAKAGAKDCKAGAAVLLDVRDNSVIAAATYPNYDLNRYLTDKDYNASISKDSTIPLFNRAISGSFPPGSTFKPLVAIGAFAEKVSKPSDRITCHGRYYYPGSDFSTKCLGVHGSSDFRYALAKSCNVYFSELGRRLGINSMNLYCKKFGLGVKTGLEIPETAGVIAGPEHSKSLGMVWSDKVTIKAAIGQSDNLFSPMQLATYTSTIANNGVRYKTHLVDKITDYNRQNIVLENSKDKPVILDQAGIPQEVFNAVKDGMRQVVLNGTASMFSSYGVSMAAKTGTAQNSGSDHTLFICYAPYENPQVALSVVIAHGAKGFASKGVAKDILDAYFNKS